MIGDVTVGDMAVPRLGFGAMRVTGDGIWDDPKDPAEAVRLLRRVVELGIRFIDTAVAMTGVDAGGMPGWGRPSCCSLFFRESCLEPPSQRGGMDG